MQASATVVNIQSAKIKAGRQATRMTQTKTDQSDNQIWTDCVINIARQKDTQAFKQLFDYYAPKLKTFFLNANFDAQQAEELVQETFIKVWRYADYFEQNKGQVSTWIYTIARNIKLDTYRKNGRQVEQVELDNHEIESEEHSQFNHAIGTQIKNFVNQLPQEQIAVIQKVYFEDLSHQKAAEALNITLGTVKGRLRSAVTQLTRLVGGQA